VVPGQLGFYFHGARLLARGQQSAQSFVHAALTDARCQMQQTQVFLAGPLRLLGQQHVVRLPKPAGREQIRLIAILRERSRLPHQPANNVAVVDVMFLLASQTWQQHHLLLGVAHLDLVRAHPRLHPLPDQPRWHRVNVVENTDRTPLTHLHPPSLQGLQPPTGQGPQRRYFLSEP
jgi:hypothetical protein